MSRLPVRRPIRLKDKFFVPADLGEIEYDEIFDKMAQELQLDKEYILTEWNKLFRFREEILPVLHKAREKADVVLLSNAPKGVVEKLFQDNNITHLFEQMTISSNVKMVKPSDEIYLHCVESTGKSYDEIYMIDDSPKNLENLHNIGITPVLFESVDKLYSWVESLE